MGMAGENAKKERSIQIFVWIAILTFLMTQMSNPVFGAKILFDPLTEEQWLTNIAVGVIVVTGDDEVTLFYTIFHSWPIKTPVPEPKNRGRVQEFVNRFWKTAPLSQSSQIRWYSKFVEFRTCFCQYDTVS